jgi:hypothetical protein
MRAGALAQLYTLSTLASRLPAPPPQCSVEFATPRSAKPELPALQSTLGRTVFLAICMTMSPECT